VKFEHDEIQSVKDAVEERLLAIPGVNAVDVSEKFTGNQPTGELAITVHVQKKKPSPLLPEDERIPPEINGIQTDVIESGPVVIEGGPYQGGIGVQTKSSGSGTVACFAETNGANSKVVLLTNQHVLFKGSDLSRRDFEVGPTVCTICSACCSEIIGKVLDPNTPARIFAVLTDLVDAATAVLNPGVQWLKEVKDIGTITGVRPVNGGDVNTLAVQKYGNTTDLTSGTVVSITHSGRSTTDDGKVQRNYRNQIRVAVASGRFSDFGDSGALYLTTARQAIGLHFGGIHSGANDGQGLACRITDVTASLGITIPTTAVAGQVQTVPGAVPMSDIEQEEVAAAAAARESDLEFLIKAQEEIVRTPKGREYHDLVRRNNFEIRRLINTNRRVATAWRRNHGPEIVQRLFEAVRSRRLEIPNQVNGASVAECVENMARIIARYASPRLRADLERYRTEFASVIGMTYERFLVELVQAREAAAT
jgi:hypothetical protein